MTALLAAMATPVWAYLALFGFLAVDAMIPVVPVQAIMITSGALTVYGNLNLAFVIIIGAVGMMTGDSIAFVLGRSSRGIGHGWLAGLRARFGPKADGSAGREESKARKAAERFTRGLRRPGPLVLLLCRFVPGGRMAANFAAGRSGYPIRKFALWDGAAALSWATYGGLVGHVGGTAITQSAWRLFVIAATAAVVFGTAGWILALFGGKTAEADGSPDSDAGIEPAGIDDEVGEPAEVDLGTGIPAAILAIEAAGAKVAGPRIASADVPLPQ